MEPRLKTQFNETTLTHLKDEFSLENPMAFPKIEKVILNVGMGRQLEGTKLNAKAKAQVLEDLTVISGQKPVMLKAKRSVSNFKLRTGYEIGAMVTLRGNQMWEFLDRLIQVAIPRIKDFRGLRDSSFDPRGSYAFGVNEQGIFPEVDMTSCDFIHGMNIQIIFKNSSKAKSIFVLKDLGIPFEKKEDKKRRR